MRMERNGERVGKEGTLHAQGNTVRQWRRTGSGGAGGAGGRREKNEGYKRNQRKGEIK